MQYVEDDLSIEKLCLLLNTSIESSYSSFFNATALYKANRHCFRITNMPNDPN